MAMFAQWDMAMAKPKISMLRLENGSGMRKRMLKLSLTQCVQGGPPPAYSLACPRLLGPSSMHELSLSQR